MADDNTIIEGSVKFRDGKKWKSRWCVMRKLSPVADCVQLEVWGEGRGGRAGSCKAVVALRHFVGVESGFALDKQAHTLAVVCAETVAVIALESRERLARWRAAAARALGPARAHLVQVAAGGRVPAGPARLLLGPRRAALVAGSPPRVLAAWDLAHLRRYGVIDGRFCFEGGSQCGGGEGLHVLIADRPDEIAADFDLASRGFPAPGRRAPADDAADGRVWRVAAVDRGPAPRLRAVSPGWGSAGDGDTASAGEPAGSAPWAGGATSIARCASCFSALGALTRSSTGGLTPVAAAPAFAPAWSMEGASPACLCPPPRSPRSAALHLHYDVPKLASVEVDEYYDTPKRLKECLRGELFTMSKSATFHSAAGAGRGCGCAARARAVAAPPPCACACAPGWLRMASCSQSADDLLAEKENARPAAALYATVDVSRKPRRKSHPAEPPRPPDARADYVNLHFALSLEHYENAKQLLRRAGATESELSAIAAQPAPADDYLAMEPAALGPREASAPGYAPMSPLGVDARGRPADAKSASNPALGGRGAGGGRAERPPRASSADSSRYLDDVKEFSDGRDSASSEETLRGAAGCGAGRGAAAAGGARAAGAGTRHSSSSNDSGVSSWSRRAAAAAGPPARRSRSSEGRRGGGAEARSSSSGTSDMSDYIETLSLCSWQWPEAPETRHTLRPRSGREYTLRAPHTLPR